MYLSSENPTLDQENSITGGNTTNVRYSAVNGFVEWKEFNYNTLISCYGDVLNHPFPSFPEVQPPLTELEREIWDEDSFEHFLSRATIPSVNWALKLAWSFCAEYWRFESAIIPTQVGRGGLASKSQESDSRFRPDWAGLHVGKQTSSGYVNLCPGDSKLATKWNSSLQDKDYLAFIQPLSQIQSYCGDKWNARYGYIITPEELWVVEISREEIRGGLSGSRPVRQSAVTQSSHTREESITSGASITSPTMSSSFEDNPTGTEYAALRYMSIPWTNHGKGKLTVRLSLWWIHMLAGAGDISVQTKYLPLDRWIALPGGYRHSSTGRIVEKLPKNGKLVNSDNTDDSSSAS